jgi:hypothetical protein
MRELNVNEIEQVNGGSFNAPEPEYIWVPDLLNGGYKKMQVSPYIFGQ